MQRWRLSAVSMADIDPILEIEQHCFRWPWNRISFLGELDCKQAGSYIVKISEDRETEQAIAYLFLRLVDEELHILRIAVAPKWRCQGVASWLLDQCFKLGFEKGAKSVFLEVRPSNESAIALYRKQGFSVVARRPNYYSDTREDALVLIKNLKEDL